MTELMAGFAGGLGLLIVVVAGLGVLTARVGANPFVY